MDLNYLRRFSAYVSTFYHSEYITKLNSDSNLIKNTTQNCSILSWTLCYLQWKEDEQFTSFWCCENVCNWGWSVWQIRGKTSVFPSFICNSTRMKMFEHNLLYFIFTWNCGVFQINEAVSFLHNLGSLQHFSNDALKSKVVINPQWIVDVMACVVSVRSNAIEVRILKVHSHWVSVLGSAIVPFDGCQYLMWIAL